MRNISTMSKFKYTILNIFFGSVMYILFRFLFFSSIHGLTVFESRVVLLLLPAVFVPLGIFITQERRNWVSLTVNVSLPFEAYTIFVLLEYFSTFYLAVFYTAAALSVIYFLIIMLQKIKSRNKMRVIFNRMAFASLGIRSIVGICLLLIMVPYGVKSFLGYGIIRSRVDTVAEYKSEEWSFDNNIDSIEKLRDETWKTLSLQEKINLLGIIKNIEISDMGIGHEVYLGAEKLSSDSHLGNYRKAEHRITLNIDWLNDSDTTGKKALAVLLHEIWHIYECNCVEAYNSVAPEYKNLVLFNAVANYKDGFENYVDAEDDPEAYASQDVEASAEWYADLGSCRYLEVIDGEYQPGQQLEDELS